MCLDCSDVCFNSNWLDCSFVVAMQLTFVSQLFTSRQTWSFRTSSKQIDLTTSKQVDHNTNNLQHNIQFNKSIHSLNKKVFSFQNKIQIRKLKITSWISKNIFSTDSPSPDLQPKKTNIHINAVQNLTHSSMFKPSTLSYIGFVQLEWLCPSIRYLPHLFETSFIFLVTWTKNIC